MTTPKLSHQIANPKDPRTELGRMYSRTPGGEPEVPSITTLIGLHNPRMEWWRGLCAGKEAVANADRIAAKLASTPDSQRKNTEKEIVDWIDKAAVRDMAIASKRGDIVHDYAEKVCRSMMGEDFDIPAEREQALEALHKADPRLDWESANGYFNSVHNFLRDFRVTPVTAEATVWNHEVGYAGTNDLLAFVDGRLTILDWKTKKKIKDPGSRWYSPSIKESIAIQLEAAHRGEERYDEESGAWVVWEGAEATDHMGVALGPNGYEAIKVIRKDDTWEMLKALKVLWDWSMPDNPHIIETPVTLETFLDN